MPALLRPTLAGIATGARSFVALAACARTPAGRSVLDRALHRRRIRRALTSSAVLELVGDKLPITPSRSRPPALAGRVAFGALAGAVVAGRAGDGLLVGAGAGAASAAAWSLLGPRVRSAVATRSGSDLTGALAEDVAAITLAALATRR